MTAIIFLVLRILLSITLYAFLLTILYVLWKDVRQQSLWLSSRKIPSISLEINIQDSPIRTQQFKKVDEITIGRDPGCDCFLDDEIVSSRHARLRYHHSQWWLEDLGSKNGTQINSLQVTNPVVLISGDEIQCGKHIITISISGETLQFTGKIPAKVNNGE
jgi:pSer/pThr/pTyr-binding forkhead associated (FHA) protein